MLKGVNVGRPRFDKVFSSVNSFCTKIDYTKAFVLGEVDAAEEKHDGKLIHRFKRSFPKTYGMVNMCFARPWQRDMSLGQSFKLAMDYGLRPAIHHEVVTSLKQARSEQVEALFDQMMKVAKMHGFIQMPLSLSVVCLGSAVSGQTGELIPVQEVVRTSERLSRLQLRKLDFDARIPSAMLIPFVSA